jgi:hypothetical protein
MELAVLDPRRDEAVGGENDVIERGEQCGADVTAAAPAEAGRRLISRSSEIATYSATSTLLRRSAGGRSPPIEAQSL